MSDTPQAVELSIRDGYIVLPTGERIARLDGDERIYFWSKSLKKEVSIPFGKFLEILGKGLYSRQTQQQGWVLC